MNNEINHYVNLWKMTGNDLVDGVNIIKTWLCNGSDGQTYPINDYYLKKIEIPDNEIKYWDFAKIEAEWDDIIGFKHEYTIDDPELDNIAKEIDKELREFIDKCNYDHSICCDFPKDEPKKTKDYYVATYKSKYSFGCVGSLIFETEDEAWNCALNDSNEYLKGRNGQNEYRRGNRRITFTSLNNNEDDCIWEIQKMKMSKEANDL